MKHHISRSEIIRRKKAYLTLSLNLVSGLFDVLVSSFFSWCFLFQVFQKFDLYYHLSRKPLSIKTDKDES